MPMATFHPHVELDIMPNWPGIRFAFWIVQENASREKNVGA
jgi:hypothetical protein